jgi:hypothetical protein
MANVAAATNEQLLIEQKMRREKMLDQIRRQASPPISDINMSKGTNEGGALNKERVSPGDEPDIERTLRQKTQESVAEKSAEEAMNAESQESGAGSAKKNSLGNKGFGIILKLLIPGYEYKAVIKEKGWGWKAAAAGKIVLGIFPVIAILAIIVFLTLGFFDIVGIVADKAIKSSADYLEAVHK